MDNGKQNFAVALTLALATLTSWEEDDKREPQRKIKRAWKGFSFPILQELEERGFIRAAMRSSSMQITEAGAKVGSDLASHLQRAFAEWIEKEGRNGKI
jgi:hypothetical protein